MKPHMRLAMVWMAGMSTLIAGCCSMYNCQSANVSQGRGSHDQVQFVETEDLQWDTTDAEDQELADEI